MNVKIQSVKFDADQKLVDFIQLKLSKIGRFADNILSADVTLKIDMVKLLTLIITVNLLLLLKTALQKLSLVTIPSCLKYPVDKKYEPLSEPPLTLIW